MLHIDADSLDGTYICAAALVEAQIPDVAGGADLRGQIDRLMAGVVPITVNRVRLGSTASSYDNGGEGIGGGEACNNVRGVGFLGAVDGCYVILIAGFVHHVCIRVSQSTGAGQIAAIAVNLIAAWCSGGRGLPVEVHDRVAGSGGQVLGRGIVGAHGREDDVIQPGAVTAIGPRNVFGVGPGQGVIAGGQGIGSLCPACGTGPLAFLYAIDVETQKVIVAFGGYLVPEAEIASAADYHRQAEGGAAVVGDSAGLGGIGAGKDLRALHCPGHGAVIHPGIQSEVPGLKTFIRRGKQCDRDAAGGSVPAIVSGDHHNAVGAAGITCGVPDPGIGAGSVGAFQHIINIKCHAGDVAVSIGGGGSYRDAAVEVMHRSTGRGGDGNRGHGGIGGKQGLVGIDAPAAQLAEVVLVHGVVIVSGGFQNILNISAAEGAAVAVGIGDNQSRHAGRVGTGHRCALVEAVITSAPAAKHALGGDVVGLATGGGDVHPGVVV